MELESYLSIDLETVDSCTVESLNAVGDISG